MRLLVLAGLLALPATAAWQRHFMTGKGGFIDSPEPHPLAYFTEYPTMRFQDFEGGIAEAKKHKVSSNLTLLGNLAGFGIYQLFYRFEDREPAGPDTKLILVKTGADEYHEIYHREPTQMDALCLPSRFIKVGDDELLEASYVIGGRSQPTQDDYFWIDRSGSTLVDFTPILAAAKSVIPAGKTLRWIYEMDGNIPGTHYLWSAGEPLVSRLRAPDAEDVQVEFKFDHGKVVPTKATYNPGK